jgi:hypothetical protein
MHCQGVAHNNHPFWLTTTKFGTFVGKKYRSSGGRTEVALIAHLDVHHFLLT